MQSNLASDNTMTSDLYRELGKMLIKSNDDLERSKGISYILKAYSGGDSEATYIVGYLILNGVLTIKEGDSEDYALSILCLAAENGNIQARSLLNAYCIKRYDESIGDSINKSVGPLVDFDGKKIKIKRTGVMTPIDATLEYIDGINRLTLSANIVFYGDEFLDDPNRFRKSVFEGIMEWQGNYRVFGNQELQVVVKLTTDERLWDNVFVVPMTDEVEENIQKFAKTFGSKKLKERTDSVVASKRSFAAIGLKWSAKSRKVIYIESEDGRFDDYEEIKHVAKHEFGHALGLGDLYENRADQLEGVEKGTYTELDGFHINRKLYNLVMCDHHGPISNNDIEMVVLAFWENIIQLYQPQSFKGKISKALGKGN